MPSVINVVREDVWEQKGTESFHLKLSDGLPRGTHVHTALENRGWRVVSPGGSRLRNRSDEKAKGMIWNCEASRVAGAQDSWEKLERCGS